MYLDGVGIGDWRTAYHETQRRRMRPEQLARLEALEAADRSADEETEFRVLSWFTDHADASRAMEWALESASVAHTSRHTFHLVPDAGHSPWRERPELVREVLRAAVG